MQSCNTFLPEPKIKTDYYNNKIPYVLLNDVRYKSNIIDGKIVRIYIRKNFRWNGADILPVFWGWLLGSRFNSDYILATLLHDFCTQNKPKFTNKQASIIFRDVLKKCGVNPIKANIMGLAVYIYQSLWFNKGWKK